MKKFIYSAIIAGALFTSCTDSNKYYVSGTFTDSKYDGKMAYLDIRGNNTDSTLITNRTFKFEGIADDTAKMGIINIDDKSSLIFFAEKGNITADLEKTRSGLYFAKGTPLNDACITFLDSLEKLDEAMYAINTRWDKVKLNELTDEMRKERKKDMQAASEKIEEYMFSTLKANADNGLNRLMLSLQGNRLKAERLAEIFALSPAGLRATDFYKEKEAETRKRLKVSEGKMFENVKGKDTDDKNIALSDYAGKGKMVLVDFWASWCGPCRQLTPELKEIYKDYQGKGFEIVSISLDEDKNKWLEAVKTDELLWPQILYLDPDTEPYAISNIPHTVLIDKDGTIIAHNLRGQMLRIKLEELLGL